MTAFASALAQLEGLSRLSGLPSDASGALSDTCAEALGRSQAAATEAQLDVEAQVRAIANIQCVGLEVKLRDALMQHGRRLLEDLKPRVNAAVARIQHPGEALRGSGHRASSSVGQEAHS
uniref:Uncharacterized protein n=1 Tax=Alexandrium catenella TaxID=2925 RepID=A0A7S1RKF4_ALECA